LVSHVVGKLERAAHSYRRCLALQPNKVSALKLLAAALEAAALEATDDEDTLDADASDGDGGGSASTSAEAADEAGLPTVAPPHDRWKARHEALRRMVGEAPKATAQPTANAAPAQADAASAAAPVAAAAPAAPSAVQATPPLPQSPPPSVTTEGAAKAAETKAAMATMAAATTKVPAAVVADADVAAPGATAALPTASSARTATALPAPAVTSSGEGDRGGNVSSSPAATSVSPAVVNGSVSSNGSTDEPEAPSQPRATAVGDAADPSGGGVDGEEPLPDEADPALPEFEAASPADVKSAHLYLKMGNAFASQGKVRLPRQRGLWLEPVPA
jgi:hypothetical protein